MVRFSFTVPNGLQQKEVSFTRLFIMILKEIPKVFLICQGIFLSLCAQVLQDQKSNGLHENHVLCFDLIIEGRLLLLGRPSLN